MSDSEFKPENITHSPLEAGQIQLKEFLNDQCPKFIGANFLNKREVKYDERVNVRGDCHRLLEINDYIARVDIDFKGKSLTVIPRVAGIVQSRYIIDQIFNNRTNKKINTYYEAKIIEAITGKESIMSIGHIDLADNKSFKTKVNTFSTLKNDECTEFVSEFISKSNPLQIEEYINSGRMDFIKINWIWENIAYYNGKIYSEDKDGNIKISDNKYVRVSKNTGRILPKYVESKKPIEQVIKELFENIHESWNGALEPFLAICFMTLSAYCPEFWKKEGFGSIAFVGDTEAGKSEITILGLGIYGYDKFFMGTTRNTLVGVEQKMNSANCVPVIIDDISKFKMSGNNFADELKRLMNGMAREKGKNGQESGTLPPCSTFGYSTNYLQVEKPEIINRQLTLDTENVKFSPEKFKYFDKGIEELSCILPHILDFGFERINEIHIKRKTELLEHYPSISDRMASQIAIAIAGMDVFTEIAKSELKIPTEKFPEYINSCMQRFTIAQSPLDKLLDAFPIMIWNGNIKEGEHYKLSFDEGFTKLTFHKVAVCLAYNKYVMLDSSEHIDSRSIKDKNTETYRMIKFNKAQKYDGDKNHCSLVLDITKHPSAKAIIDKHFRLRDMGVVL